MPVRPKSDSLRTDRRLRSRHASLREAKDNAVTEMIQAARALGADALLGVDLDYESISLGQGGGMLMVTASGTAVKL